MTHPQRRNELDKVCFQHDMAYGDFKDLPRRTASDKVLHDKTFNITKILKYAGYQRGFFSMVYRFSNKMKLNKMNNEQTNYVNQLLENLKNEKYP